MKISIFLSLTIIFSYFSNLYAKELNLPGWEKEWFGTNSVTYKKNDPDATLLVVQRFKLEKKKEWNETTVKNHLKILEQKRGELLSYGGITHFKIDKHQFKNSKEAQIINYEGSYVGVTGKTVFYNELSIYKERDHFQFLLTQEGKKEIDPKIVKEMLECLNEGRPCII